MSAKLQSNRGDILAGFAEALKDSVKECLMTYSPAGVFIHGADGAQTVQAQCDLPASLVCADGQGTYEFVAPSVPEVAPLAAAPKAEDESCEEAAAAAAAAPVSAPAAPPVIVVGMDTKMVSKCLSNVACGDLVSFGVDTVRDPEFMSIVCQGNASGRSNFARVVMPDDNGETPAPFDSTFLAAYNGEITVSSMLFHDTMRDLCKSDWDVVRVYCDGERLVFVADGNQLKSSSEMRRGSEARHFRYEPKPGDSWPVAEAYPISYFQKVAKAKGVAPNVSILLRAGYPIVFRYRTSIGTLGFFVSPQERDEDEDPALSRMPPPHPDIVGVLPRTRARESGESVPATPTASGPAAAPGPASERLAAAAERWRRRGKRDRDEDAAPAEDSGSETGSDRDGERTRAELRADPRKPWAAPAPTAPSAPSVPAPPPLKRPTTQKQTKKHR